MSRSSYPLIFERSRPGRKGCDLPQLDVPALDHLIPAEYAAKAALPLPEIAEVDAVRHYTNLSRRNFGVDNGFYPLGSCTMKYNPKINEEVATLFDGLHPLADEDCAMGAIRLMAELDRALCAITGFDKFTLQPAAGAHGELTGLMLIKAYHDMRQDFGRKVMIIPDAAHGTNPASAVMAGFETRELVSAPDGGIDLEALRAACGPDTAGLMLTNPSTLGLFERNIVEVAKIVHNAGGLLYYDGANLNAIMGAARPADMGFDVMHINLHKTFSTPHGGGGPGSGPVGVTAQLIPFLPTPVVMMGGNGTAALDYDRPLSIGKVKGFYGNFSVMAKAYAYILSLGAEGLKEASENAVLNANYIQNALKDVFFVPHERVCMHECVLAPTEAMQANGVHTTDIAKTLIDYGYHPPTIYFPLIVHEAIMIEPTESESRETLDGFIEVMRGIAKTALENPEQLHASPTTTPVGRPDEVQAARKPVVRFCE
jgi:glycine dehydrogenase subunit 2